MALGSCLTLLQSLSLSAVSGREEEAYQHPEHVYTIIQSAIYPEQWASHSKH